MIMETEARDLSLPSGRVATVRRGKGRDLIRAHRAVAGNPEPIAVSLALVAELTQVDGQPLVYEDILAMDLTDVLVLQNEVMGGSPGAENFPETRTDLGAPVQES